MNNAASCRICGKTIEDDAKFCPFCGAGDPVQKSVKPPPKPAAPSPKPILQTSPPTTASTPTTEPKTVAERVQKRYRDAYRVAATRLFMGNVMKAVGMALGILGLLAAISFANEGRGTDESVLAFGFTVSVLAFLIFFVLGVMINAGAQLLQATLDQAVYASPFLDDDQRLEAMSIRRPKPATK